LACALWTLPDLARWFISDAAGASPPSPGGIPKIRTQGLLGGSGQPDMEITYRSVSGPACILSEQKADADLTQYQRAGYPGWVRDKLVLVAPDTGKYRRAPQFDAHISWLRIAQEMHRIAARRGQSAWREKALLPEEPSVLRFLHEVLSFIERQDVGVSGMDPIDAARTRSDENTLPARPAREIGLDVPSEELAQVGHRGRSVPRRAFSALASVGAERPRNAPVGGFGAVLA
jgi:hypothetical protein